MSHQYLGFWLHSRRLTSLVVGIVFLISAVPAYAEFKPRDRKPASGYSRAGGSRGCPNSGGIPLTQLAPETFIGKTASTRPMLAWYMSNSQNVEFKLGELNSDGKLKDIGEAQEILTTIGINKLKLPLNYPELTVGKTYLWQIAIDCGSDTIFTSAEFIVINPESLAKNQFTSIPESVNYYAENDLWYEALEEALKVTGNGKLGEAGGTLVKELAQSEMPIGSEVQRIKYLQRIASDR